MGRRKGFKKDAGTQCTRVIMHIVTFFSFAGGTIAFFFFSLAWSFHYASSCISILARRGGERERWVSMERGKGIRDWVCRSGGIEGAW